MPLCSELLILEIFYSPYGPDIPVSSKEFECSCVLLDPLDIVSGDYNTLAYFLGCVDNVSEILRFLFSQEGKRLIQNN